MSGPQIFIMDSTYNFNWNLSDGNGVDSTLIYYSIDDGVSYNFIGSYDGYLDSISYIFNIDSLITHQGKFKVIAKDYAGNIADVQSERLFTIVGDSLIMSIEPGWNLWGVPLIPSESLLSSNLEDDLTGSWYSYRYFDNGYIFDSTLSISHGYWLGLMEESNIDITGTPVDQDYEMDSN